MKKFLISLTVFTIFTSVVYIIGIVCFGRYAPKAVRLNLQDVMGGVGYSYTRFQEAELGSDVDVLVLGSSHAYRGYDPRIFYEANLKMFNLGSSSQTPVQTEYLANKYLDHFKPKLVILDVYPILFKSDGVESVIDLLSNSKLDKELIDLSLQNRDIRIYNTLIYRYCKDVFNFDKDYKESLHQKNGDSYIKGGFVESKSKFESKNSYDPAHYTFLPAQKIAFSNIVEKLKSRNIPYIILQSPIPQKKYSSIINNREADSLFSQYGPYQNANEALKLPDSCFIDESHLNQSGVDIYNAYVLNLLKKQDNDRSNKITAK